MAQNQQFSHGGLNNIEMEIMPGEIVGWLVSISMGTPIVCINVGEHGFGCLIISNFCQVF